MTNPSRYLLFLMLLAGPLLMAAELHVSPDGAATGFGTREKPFATIQQAADATKPGDKVIIHAGTYRESSGSAPKSITITAAADDKVVLSGADPLDAKWTKHEGNIFKTRVAGPVRQVLVDGELMIEARWPNMSFDRLWDRDRWAAAGEGSRYGKMVDPELAKTNVDWTGAVATLNVAHQFFTWTRTVGKHEAGSDTFEYAKDLEWITHYADKTRQWEDDRYYLTGKLEALDAPGEWFHDSKSGMLYLQTHDGKNPTGKRVELKTRNYAFHGEQVRHLALQGIHFEACTFHFKNCQHLSIDNCHVRYPNVARRIGDPDADEFDAAETSIAGNDNRVTRCSFAYGPGSALKIVGRRNLVEDCLMHDFCWDGSLKTPMLAISSSEREPAEDRCTVRHCTMFNCGNAIVNYRGFPGHIIELNHVYNGGLCCKDVALVYTGQPSIAGSVVRYNWVHGCFTEHEFKKEGGVVPGGLGIRGDDQTRSLTLHHNVVWDCGRDGIIVKGDNNRVFNNTVFDIGSPQVPGNHINLHTMAEPEKYWRKQHPLLPEQNKNSQITNNLTLNICGDNKGLPYPFAKNMSHNHLGNESLLVDAAAFDFRPKPNSPLIDAGKSLPGFTEGHHGNAPDIGAYEHGGDRWIPGIRWDPKNVLGQWPEGFTARPAAMSR